jgi:hypothetical protein
MSLSTDDEKFLPTIILCDDTFCDTWMIYITFLCVLSYHSFLPLATLPAKQSVFTYSHPVVAEQNDILSPRLSITCWLNLSLNAMRLTIVINTQHTDASSSAMSQEERCYLCSYSVHSPKPCVRATDTKTYTCNLHRSIYTQYSWSSLKLNAYCYHGTVAAIARH